MVTISFFIGLENKELLQHKTAVCYQSTSPTKIDFKKRKDYFICWKIKYCKRL